MSNGGEDNGGDSGALDLVEKLSVLSLLNEYEAQLYELKLQINHTKPNFNGELGIRLKRKDTAKANSSMFELKLHAAKIVVIGAELRAGEKTVPLKTSYDRKAQTLTLTGDGADVEASQKDVSVQMRYMGQINPVNTYKDQTRGLFKTNYLDRVSGRSDNYLLATHCQPYFCRAIFPLIDEAHSKVPIKLTIVTKLKFKVLSNCGLERDPEPLSLSDESVFEFKQTPPIAPSVFGFVIGDMDYVENSEPGFPCRIYCPVGEASSCAYPLFVTSQVVKTAIEELKTPYPLDKLDFVALPFLSDGAMENWGLITVLTSQLLVSESADKSAKLNLRQLIAHELVHQWIGNLVSFDDWSCLWLNESFATFLGNYLLSKARLSPEDYNETYEWSHINHYESLLDEDCLYDEVTGKSYIPSIQNFSTTVDTGLNSSTATLFDKAIYEKGMVLLHMIAQVMQSDEKINKFGEVSYNKFLNGMSEVLHLFKHASVKPFDIWQVLNKETSVDLLSFMHSWTRYEGYPLLSVSYENGEVVIEQNRFIYNNDPKELGVENNPYHVPLFVRILNDSGEEKLLNLVLTDRRTSLNIPLDNFVLINSGRAGYYKTVYRGDTLDRVCDSISKNKLSLIEIAALIHDYGKLIGQKCSSSADIVSFFKILSALISDSWIIDYRVLDLALIYIDTFKVIFLHFTEYSAFEKKLKQFYTKLYKKIGKWEKIQNVSRQYSVYELRARNSTLQGVADEECIALCKKLFKNYVNPKNDFFLPKELVSAVLNNTMRDANQKEYKQVLLFVKNADASNLKHTNCMKEDFQTLALSSLAFVESDDLLHKTLNFVATNIDSKLIELGLLGFQFKLSRADKLKLWNWYKVNYDKFALRSLRKGSDWSKQIGATLKNITDIVLGSMMQYEPELIEQGKTFVESKIQKLPEHGLSETVKDIQSKNSEKILVASFYDDLVRQWDV